MIGLAVRILLFVHSRTVRGILADRPPLKFFYTATDWNCLCPTCADRPRSFGGLSAMNFCGWQLLCRASGGQSLWTADCPPHTRGLSALPKIWQPRIFSIFTISTLNWEHCSNKIPKISRLARTPSKDSYEWVRMRNQKSKQVKSRKLINSP